MLFQLSRQGTLRIDRKDLVLDLHLQFLVGLADFHRDVFQQGNHAQTVDPPSQVIVEAVESPGMRKTAHHSRNLPVGKRTA